MRGHFVSPREDCGRPAVGPLERRGVKAELVQQHTQCPHIRALVNDELEAEVDHLGCAVPDRSVHVEFLFELFLFVRRTRRPAIAHLEARAKVAQLELRRARLAHEDVFNLQVAVDEHRVHGVHHMDAAAHVAKDAQNLALVEALLQARVEKVDQPAPRAALHQDKDLPAVALEVRRRGLDKVHDRRVPVQQSVVRDLGTHGGECVLVPDAHVLQHECRGRLAARQLHRLVGLYKIDVRKAALAQKALHRHDMLANLDARPRHKPPLPLERRHGSTRIGHGPCPARC